MKVNKVFNIIFSSWIPTIIWCSFIFFLSSQPIIQQDTFDLANFAVKKSAHVFEYFILTMLLLLKTGNPQVIIFSLLYAFTDETHQLFTPGRTGSLRDVLLFDSLGIILAFLTVRFSSRFKK